MVMPRRRRWNKQKPTAIFQPNVENPLILERKPVNRRDYGDILNNTKPSSPNRRRTNKEANRRQRKERK